MSDGTKAVESSKVWTTLLTNTKYLTGLLVLDYSLQKSKSAYPLVVLYTDTFEAEGIDALKRRGIAAQKVDYLLPSVHKDYGQDVRFYDCWSKLVPFSLTQYERIVQLDSDMLVMRNMDELMQLPLDPAGDRVFAASHACVCNPLGKAHYPADWIPENCAFTSQHDDAEKAQTVGAPGSTGLGICNGGLQVVNPSKATYDLIATTLSNPSATSNYDFADQSLLSDLFKDRWVALPYTYNALKTLRWCHAPIWRDEEAKNVHYILSPKPWDSREGVEEENVVSHGWWWTCDDERRAEEVKNGIEDGF